MALAALKRDPNSPQAISAVAQQVEALFLQMMLKSMRDATAAGRVDRCDAKRRQHEVIGGKVVI